MIEKEGILENNNEKEKGGDVKKESLGRIQKEDLLPFQPQARGED